MPGGNIKSFLKNLHENNCGGIPYLMKLQAMAYVMKKNLQSSEFFL